MTQATQTVLLTRNFLFLNLAHLIQALGYTSMLLLPLYLSLLGANRATIGLIVAVGSVGSLCARPLIGWSLDGWGRKPTLLIGTVLVAVGMAGIGLVTDLGPAIYLVRICIGVGVGALFTGYFAFAADMIPASRRTEGIALFGITGLLPLLINPFATKIGIAPIDLRWFLPIIGGIIATSMLALWPIKEAPRPPEQTKYNFAEAWHSLKARPLWSVWLGTILLSAQIATFMAFVTVSATERGIPNATSLWMTYAFGAISVRVFGARLPDRIGPANLVAPALAVYGIAMVLAAMAQDSNSMMLAGFFGGLGHGYCFPVLTSQVVSRVPNQHRGSGLSMFTALWGISEIVIAPLLGAFADRFGDSAMFSLSSVCVAALLLLWLPLEHIFGQPPSTTPSEP